jgi:hydroxyethylthiazole kinase-like uncharacterized protein yjeF
MAKLVSVAEMQAIEKAADAAGLSYARMMANAGRKLAEEVAAHSHKAKSALGLVGKGNNGGDTLIALLELSLRGWRVTAYIVGERADEHVNALEQAGAEIFFHSQERESRQLLKAVSEHAVLLDGLLGTGAKLPLRAEIAEVLSAVKARVESPDAPFVVAVDCPSGMDCNSGDVAKETLRADLTVCMAAVKQGMLTLPAYEYLGELVIAELGLPADLGAWTVVQHAVIDEEMARAELPARPLDAHKGTFGTALVVAGSRNYPGAALLAGRAAYRSGAGLVQMAVPESVQMMLAGHLPEATWLPLAEADGGFAKTAARALGEQLKRATAMLLGPGLGQGKETGAFVAELLKQKLPRLVVDADGLRWLAELKDWHRLLPAETVLTPHPGEMAILTGMDKDAIQSARRKTAQKFAAKWNSVVVLKGAFTVIAAADGRTATLPIVTPALARAGTGDVLAGLITGLRAQGVVGYEAACTAAWLHAQAGLRAAERLGGTAGVLAGDVVDEIAGVIGK